MTFHHAVKIVLLIKKDYFLSKTLKPNKNEKKVSNIKTQNCIEFMSDA